MNYTNISIPMRYNNERYVKAGLAGFSEEKSMEGNSEFCFCKPV